MVNEKHGQIAKGQQEYAELPRQALKKESNPLCQGEPSKGISHVHAPNVAQAPGVCAEHEKIRNTDLERELARRDQKIALLGT